MLLAKMVLTVQTDGLLQESSCWRVAGDACNEVGANVQNSETDRFILTDPKWQWSQHCDSNLE